MGQAMANLLGAVAGAAVVNGQGKRLGYLNGVTWQGDCAVLAVESEGLVREVITQNFSIGADAGGCTVELRDSSLIHGAIAALEDAERLLFRSVVREAGWDYAMLTARQARLAGEAAVLGGNMVAVAEDLLMAVRDTCAYLESCECVDEEVEADDAAWPLVSVAMGRTDLLAAVG